MLLRLLKNIHVPGILFQVFLFTILWIRYFIDPPSAGDVTAMPLYNFIFGTISERPVLSVLVSMLIYLVSLFLVVRLNIIHFLLTERSFMPAAFFVMISLTFPEAMVLNPILLSVPFLCLSLIVLVRGNEHSAEPLALFNATLWLAAGSLFYLKVLLFIPFLWITAFIIRPLRIRGFINPILVLGMLGLFLITYYWVFLDNLPALPEILYDNLSFAGSFKTKLSIPGWILLSYLLILIMVSSFRLVRNFHTRKIIVRKLYKVLFLLFIYALVFYSFVTGFRPEVMTILAIPLAYLFSNFFTRVRSHWIHELMIWAWLLLILFRQYYDFFIS